MTDDEGRAIAKASADAEIARAQIQQTERYLAGGRRYQDISNADLTALWIAGMQEYARVIHPRPQSVDDTGAEFSLRGIEPPWHAVSAETAHLRAAAEASLRGMTDDERDAFGADMIEKYLDEKERSQ